MCIQSIYNYNSNHNNYHNVVVAFYNTTGIPIGGDDDAYYYHDEINNNNGNDNDNHMDDINTTYDTIHVGDNAIRNGNVVGNDDIDVYNYHYLPFVNFEHLQFLEKFKTTIKTPTTTTIFNIYWVHLFRATVSTSWLFVLPKQFVKKMNL